MTLNELIEEFGTSGFVLCDKGNGCGFGEDGQLVEYDDDSRDEYGDIELKELKEACFANDGTECNYESEWIVRGDGDNPYQIRIRF